MALVALVGGWEWSRLAGYTAMPVRLVFVCFLAIGLVANVLFAASLISLMLIAAVIFWLLISSLILTQPQQLLDRPVNSVLLLLVGALVLLATHLSLIWLRNDPVSGPDRVMYLLMLIWIADSAAYFVGRACGKRRLAPLVSPKKSIEGAAGGLAACLVFAFFAADHFDVTKAALAGFVSVSASVAAISIFGDLFESLIKRKAGVKDSGNLLPGHGGILDRIDSLMAAAPCFVFGLWLIELAS